MAELYQGYIEYENVEAYGHHAQRFTFAVTSTCVEKALEKALMALFDSTVTVDGRIVGAKIRRVDADVVGLGPMVEGEED